MSTSPFSTPVQQPEDAPFWEAARQGRFLVRRCAACGQTHWYPRPICPFCGGDAQWEEHDRTATVYSFTIVAKSPTGPFALGYFEFADGLRVYGRVGDTALDALRIGLEVDLTFSPAADGTPVPVFMLKDRDRRVGGGATQETNNGDAS